MSKYQPEAMKCHSEMISKYGAVFGGFGIDKMDLISDPTPITTPKSMTIRSGTPTAESMDSHSLCT